jgi:hypothetical protein
MVNLLSSIAKFTQQLQSCEIEIYNEFSLQHELGIFLRNKHPEWKIQFERNVSHFYGEKKNFTKKELDIAITSKDGTDLLSAIELKYPRNGQYPEQMFSFCKDIAFAEELHKFGFKQTVFLVIVDDPLFHSGNADGIYGYFREKKPLTGVIKKPTGTKGDDVTIDGSYIVDWAPINDRMKYAVISIGAN